jgi:hypothetical protein
MRRKLPVAELATDVPAIAQRAAARMPRHLRGMLARELLAHGRHLQVYWALWLAFGIACPVFVHPGWILALGLAYALFAVPAIAGLDARDGSEEFSFALPATRSEIFRLRLLVALGNLVALLAVALGAMAVGLSGRLWSLVADSGFAVPAVPAGLAWYALAALMPIALASCHFAGAALGRGRGAFPAALAIALTAIVSAIAVLAEMAVWGHVASVLVAPALAMLSAAALLYGHRSYLRKEGLPHPDAPRSGAPWIALVVIGIVVLLLLLFLLMRARVPASADAPPRLIAPMSTPEPPQQPARRPAPADGAEPHSTPPATSAP